MKHKEIRKQYCDMCGVKTQNGAMFCSKECEEDHYSYVEVTLPVSWVDKTLRKMNKKDRYNEVIKFSIRHEFRFVLVEKKLKEYHSMILCKDKI